MPRLHILTFSSQTQRLASTRTFFPFTPRIINGMNTDIDWSLMKQKTEICLTG